LIIEASVYVILLLATVVTLKKNPWVGLIIYVLSLVYYAAFFDKVLFPNVVVSVVFVSLGIFVGIVMASRWKRKKREIIITLMVVAELLLISTPFILKNNMAQPVEDFTIYVQPVNGGTVTTYMPCCMKYDLFEYHGTNRIFLYTYRSWNILFKKDDIIAACTDTTGTFVDGRRTYECSIIKKR
jgi:hypothetical protein